MKRLAIGLIHGYQRFLSPGTGPSCRFEPSCSEYGAQAIEHYGVLRGGFKTAWRIARCNPLSAGGYDPPVGAADPPATPPAEHDHGRPDGSSHAGLRP